MAVVLADMCDLHTMFDSNGHRKLDMMSFDSRRTSVAYRLNALGPARVVDAATADLPLGDLQECCRLVALLYL